MARRAISMARDVGDRRTLLGALRNGCSALMDRVDAAERLPLNREMARLAAELDSPLDALRSAQRLAFDHIELGERARVVEALSTFQSLATSLAHPFHRARAEGLAQSEDRGNDRRGGLAQQREAMIEVEGVGRRAVGEGRLQRRSLESLADDAGFLLGLFLPGDFRANFCVLLPAAGERHAEAIAHRRLRRLHRGGGNALVF